MVREFIGILQTHAVELVIIAVVGFVLLLVLGYAVAKASDHGIRSYEDESQR